MELPLRRQHGTDRGSGVESTVDTDTGGGAVAADPRLRAGESTNRTSDTSDQAASVPGASSSPAATEAQAATATHANAADPDRDETPDDVTDIGKAGWVQILKRAVKQFGHDHVTDRAAALTYYGILSIFPGMLVLVSLLGLVGTANAQSIINNLGQAVPGSVNTFLQSVIKQVQGKAGAASLGAIVGLLIAVWSASGYVSGFMNAANAIYEIPEGRPIYVKIPVRIGTTIALMLMLIVSALIVVVTGPIADQVGQALGLGSTLVTVWSIAKWPVLVILVSLMFSLLYWATPNVKQPGFKWITPGGFVAVIVWLIASAAFGVYVSFSGSYNKTYGTLATVIVFLVWLWITNIAILLGLEFNSETERQRALEAGLPPQVEPYVELRSTKKLEPETKEELERAADVRRRVLSKSDGSRAGRKK